MGLDMYLTATLYTYGAKYEKGRAKQINNNIRKIMPEIFRSGNLDSITISFEVEYWRKANQIHGWFVSNVQNDKDECQESDVSREQLKELLELCKKIMKIAKIKKGKIKNGFSIDAKGKKVYNVQEGKLITNVEEVEKELPTTEGSFFGSTDYDQYYIEDIKSTIEIIERCLKLPEEWSFNYRASW